MAEVADGDLAQLPGHVAEADRALEDARGAVAAPDVSQGDPAPGVGRRRQQLGDHPGTAAA